MGWDIVAIGTHHTLPLDNPVETAKRLALILDGIVSVGYTKRYEYDNQSNTISNANYEWIELEKHTFNRDGFRYIFEIDNEDSRRLLPQITSLEEANWIGEYTKSFFLDELFGTPYHIFRIGIDHERVVFQLDIYIENVDFDVAFNGRWFTFEDVFKQHYEGENKQKLDAFRNYIYDQLKASGCNKAYYFPDQGFGESLYDVINLPSDEWVSYMESREYIEDDDETQFIIKMVDYINGKIMLRQDQNVICVIDDFSDFK